MFKKFRPAHMTAFKTPASLTSLPVPLFLVYRATWVFFEIKKKKPLKCLSKTKDVEKLIDSPEINLLKYQRQSVNIKLTLSVL